jgi:hypothetical protein
VALDHAALSQEVVIRDGRRDGMSLPERRTPGAGANRRGSGGGSGSRLPAKRGLRAGHQQQQPQLVESRQLSTLPPSSGTGAEWTGLSLQGLQEVTVRSLGAVELRKLALALLGQWRRDVDIWSSTLSGLRGALPQPQRTAALAAVVQAEAEAAEALHAVRVAEAAGAPPEITQRLRDDAERKGADAERARQLASEATRLGPLQQACTTLYIEGSEEELSIQQALALVADGTIQPETLIFSDEELFPFEGWVPWSECAHCFIRSAAGAGGDGSGKAANEVSSSASFYYSVDGSETSEEISVAELSGLLRRGTLTADTLIYSDDEAFPSENWLPWSECCGCFGKTVSGSAASTGSARDGADAKKWQARIHTEREKSESAVRSLAEVERLATLAASAAAAQAQAAEEKLAQAKAELLNAQSALAVAGATNSLPEMLVMQLRQDVASKEAVVEVVQSLAHGQAEGLREAEAAAVHTISSVFQSFWSLPWLLL